MQSSQVQERDYSSSSDSDSCVEIVPNRIDKDSVLPAIPAAESVQPAPSAADSQTEFWMATRQTQCGAVLTERMVSFMKAITAAQAEFADKLAAIAAGELARSKSGADDSAVYHEYWVQMQLAMRLCRTMSQSTKEMTAAVGQLVMPMERIVGAGRSRLKDSAVWNVELNRALSQFHTNVAKRQAKCYKALAVVMTPEYFDQSPAKKSHAVRRAAPTVSKYVEQIDEANAWLTKYMSQRPVLKNRLESLEAKRVEITRNALTTFAVQIKSMGQVMTETATDIINGINSIDDAACRAAFIADCRAMPTPHLENPALFEYTLPVPLTELGIRAVREPRARPAAVMIDDESVIQSEQVPETVTNASRTARQPSETSDSAAIGKRLSSFANKMFGNQPQASRSAKLGPKRAPARETADEETGVEDVLEEDAAAHVESSVVINAADEQITRFGNIVIRPTESANTKNLSKLAMRTARRTSAVANVEDMDTSFTNGASAPTA